MSSLAAGLALLRYSPPWLARIAGRLLVLTYLAFSPRVRREILANQAKVLDRVERWFWLRQAWRLGDNLCVMARIGTRWIEEQLDNTWVHGENILERIMLNGLPTVVVTLHFGVWELLPQLFARKGYRVCVGLGEQHDRRFGESLAQLRGNQGVRVTARANGMLEALAERALLGFVLDNTSRTQGQECSTLAPGMRVLSTPFVLARATGAVLVPMFITKGREGLEARIGTPVTNAAEFGVQARARIQASPEDWVFWGKR